LATSAAPTYFEPETTESGLQLLDGGIWANNPVMLATVEALGYLEQPRETISVLRIGTTEEIHSVKNSRVSGGMIPMARPLIEFMLRGQSQSAVGMVQHLIGKERLYEIQPLVAAGDFKLDKLNKKMEALAEAEWRHASSELASKGFFDHIAKPYKPFYKL
jgi:patatin-like phospholipase/acyl hydrolase